MKRYFVAGGAGFIGSHLVGEILKDQDAAVTVYDNFSSGRDWHLPSDADAGRLRVVKGDIKDRPALESAMGANGGNDHVYHFASNPDIAKAVTQPDIDFWEGTYLTQNILEAIRITGVKYLTYASGSGIYGDIGTTPATEDQGPLLPISTYGASKLAGEALICSYCHMFGISAAAFRFANVVGPHQTHGVGYDFVLRLLRDPKQLRILGDGTQSKSYIYVDDVVAAMRLIESQGQRGFEYFNAATLDYVTVRQIAQIAAERLGLKDVKHVFTGGDRGWKGDIPIVRFDSTKLRSRGWTNRRTAVQALTESIDSMIADARAGRFPE